MALYEKKYKSKSIEVRNHIYGYLYNWHVTDRIANTTSAAWRLPSVEQNNSTTSDMWTLIDYIISLGYASGDVGNALKSCRQVNSPLGGDCDTTVHPRWDSDRFDWGTNDFEFAALPSGSRAYTGPFQLVGGTTAFWASNEYSATYAYNMRIRGSYGDVSWGFAIKTNGNPIRLVRDATASEQAYVPEGVKGHLFYVGNDGKTYNCVRIGTQVWTAENLIETKYNDGTDITEITGDSAWNADTTGARCSYNNDETTWAYDDVIERKLKMRARKATDKTGYGALYNWHVTQKELITGFGIPTRDQFTELTTNTGGSSGSGTRLKSTRIYPTIPPRWSESSIVGSNLINFSALPAGYRFLTSFYQIENNFYMWLSTEYSSTDANILRISSTGNDAVIQVNSDKTNGASIRCVRNVTLDEFLLIDGTFLQPVQDYDGNWYEVVKIGTQAWTVQNLRTTHYADGTPIPNVTDNTDWGNLTTDGMCWYNNDSETPGIVYTDEDITLVKSLPIARRYY